VGDLLRGELGFEGVVITDDIGMRAISDAIEHADAVERMLNAGTDLIDLCAYGTDTARALVIAEQIAAGHRAGRISARALDASAERIERLLEMLPQYPVTALDAAVFAEHATVAPLHATALQGAGTWQRPA
jgi:beta-N-acetylhexosaminidase